MVLKRISIDAVQWLMMSEIGNIVLYHFRKATAYRPNIGNIDSLSTSNIGSVSY